MNEPAALQPITPDTPVGTRVVTHNGEHPCITTIAKREGNRVCLDGIDHDVHEIDVWILPDLAEQERAEIRAEVDSTFDDVERADMGIEHARSRLLAFIDARSKT